MRVSFALVMMMVVMVVPESTYLSPDICRSAAVETSTIASTNADTDSAVVTVRRLDISRLNIHWPHINWLDVRSSIDRTMRIYRRCVCDSATVPNVTVEMLRGSSFTRNKHGQCRNSNRHYQKPGHDFTFQTRR